MSLLDAITVLENMQVDCTREMRPDELSDIESRRVTALGYLGDVPKPVPHEVLQLFVAEHRGLFASDGRGWRMPRWLRRLLCRRVMAGDLAMARLFALQKGFEIGTNGVEEAPGEREGQTVPLGQWALLNVGENRVIAKVEVDLAKGKVDRLGVPLGCSFGDEGVAAMVHAPTCPDPSKARAVCSCGENVSCSSCGWGSGVNPCKCVREGWDTSQ